eukprot:scaffold39999_cov63-Phaeocystis_antarctica.AAC.4
MPRGGMAMGIRSRWGRSWRPACLEARGARREARGGFSSVPVGGPFSKGKPRASRLAPRGRRVLRLEARGAGREGKPPRASPLAAGLSLRREARGARREARADVAPPLYRRALLQG